MFEYVNRHQERDIILLHGWAFDHRIFQPLDIPFNYYLYKGSHPDFECETEKLIKENNIEAISFFGWSIGAFLSADFAVKNPSIVDELYLVGVRKKYPKLQLKVIKRFMNKSKNLFLKGFYKQVFWGSDPEITSWFRENLKDDYLAFITLDELKRDLDYLSRAEVDTEALKQIGKVTFIHSENDRVAPVKEARELAQKSNADLIELKKGGHVPFLENGFSGKLCLKEQKT